MVILDLGDFLNHHLCLIIDVMLNRDWRSGKLVCSPGGLGAGEFELLDLLELLEELGIFYTRRGMATPIIVGNSSEI